MIKSREAHSNPEKLQRITLKFNIRETKTQVQFPVRTLENTVSRGHKLQIHQRKNIFMSEHGEVRQQTAIVLQKE